MADQGIQVAIVILAVLQLILAWFYLRPRIKARRLSWGDSLLRLGSTCLVLAVGYDAAEELWNLPHVGQAVLIIGLIWMITGAAVGLRDDHRKRQSQR